MHTCPIINFGLKHAIDTADCLVFFVSFKLVFIGAHLGPPESKLAPYGHDRGSRAQNPYSYMISFRTIWAVLNGAGADDSRDPQRNAFGSPLSSGELGCEFSKQSIPLIMLETDSRLNGAASLPKDTQVVLNRIFSQSGLNGPLANSCISRDILLRQ